MSTTADKLNTGKESGPRRSLDLFVPERATPPPDSFLLDAKETQAWFETLPVANIGETARRVFNTLVEFNRMELPDALRARIVEQFREPVEYVIGNLERHYLELGFPLSAKGRKIATLSRELQSELGIAYKIIIEQTLAGSSDKFDHKLLVVALHRALWYLSRVVLHNALIYSTTTEGLWREIHTIFAYASQNRIHRVPVRETGDSRRANASTLEEQYVALLLFATASPARMRQRDMKTLVHHTREWASACRLFMPDSDGSVSMPGVFVVDLWADDEPLHGSMAGQFKARRVRLLDLRQLLKQLRSQFDQVGTPAERASTTGIEQLGRPILRHLMRGWSKPPERQFVRTKLNFELHIAVGLSTIHQLQNTDVVIGGEDLSDEPEVVNPFDLPDTASNWADSVQAPSSLNQGRPDNELGGDSLFAESQFGSVGVGGTPPPDVSPSWSNETASIESDIHKVHTCNESAGGYCIAWEGDQIPRIKIGELVGVQSASDARQFGVCLVRWMNQSPGETLMVGVQVISPACDSGEVKPAVSGRAKEQAEALRCLVLPSQGASKENASLVLNALHFQVGTSLWLMLGDDEHLIRLTRLLEYTGAVAHFEFVYVREGDRVNSRNDGEDEKDFGSLWSSL